MSLASARTWLRRQLPGVAVALVIAIAASFLSLHYRASAMLFALLLGMALNFLAEDARCGPGIQWASTVVLRVGVALLGVRITLDQVSALGWWNAGVVITAVVATLLAGIAFARLLGLRSAFGTLTGGAVAICGASAALAIASLLPRHADSDRDASFAVIGVTALSTLAMILYPLAVNAFQLDATAAGVFLGGTIHDVAQVVGAGYGMSVATGDTATIVKLLRVAMLLPICLAIGLVLRAGNRSGTRSAPLLPWFAVVFALLVVANSLGWVPSATATVASDLSRWCLVTAIAAIGVKTSLKSLVDIGPAPVLLVLAETVFLAVVVLVAIRM